MHARVANLFLVCEPLRGWRAVRVSDRRTRLDWAACVRELVAAHYPEAEAIVVVLDRLTAHSPASLSEAFAPAEDVLHRDGVRCGLGLLEHAYLADVA